MNKIRPFGPSFIYLVRATRLAREAPSLFFEHF